MLRGQRASAATRCLHWFECLNVPHWCPLLPLPQGSGPGQPLPMLQWLQPRRLQRQPPCPLELARLLEHR